MTEATQSATVAPPATWPQPQRRSSWPFMSTRHGEAANETGPLRRYVVTIGQRGHCRLLFECMAVDSMTATTQHMGLSLPGERVEVRAVS